MWSELERAIETGPVLAYGATPGWAAWFAAQRAAHELVVVVAADEAIARELEDDVHFFAGNLDVATLPGIDVSPYAELSPDRACIVERVATLYRLTQPALRPNVVVTSADALARKTLPPAELAARGITIAKGDTVDRDQLAERLIAGGWSRTPVVDEPGTFALRGGVIDVYTPRRQHAHRPAQRGHPRGRHA
jgi:transcription-repair coupling factor (superfamily II helicase)